MLSPKKLTCLLPLIGAFVSVSSAIGETASNSLWSKFESTRQKIPALHLEFEVEKHFKSGYTENVLRRRVIVDLFAERVAEKPSSQAGFLRQQNPYLCSNQMGPSTPARRKTEIKISHCPSLMKLSSSGIKRAPDSAVRVFWKRPSLCHRRCANPAWYVWARLDIWIG